MSTKEILELPAGTQIGDFRILRLLGHGGMGEVYLARDMQLGRKVALKLIHPSLVQQASSKKHFLFEARATAHFNHPNIVTIHNVGEYQQRPYVALEYLEGENLRERLNQETLPQKQILRMMISVVEALEEAHKHQLLHRDLKPENIFLPKDGRVRVLDFGLAKRLEDAPSLSNDITSQAEDTQRWQHSAFESLQSIRGAIVGTPPYMAPEQWRNEPLTPATDIWALGIILFEMLTGKTPFSSLGGAMATLEIAMAHMSSQPPNPRSMRPDREIPPALAQAVLRALEKEPAQRFPSAKAFWEALAPIATQLTSGPPSYASQPPAETDRQETSEQDDQVFESQEFASDEFLRPDSFSSKQSGELYVEEDEFLRAPATPDPTPSPTPPTASSSDFSNVLSGPTLVGAQVDLSNYQPVDNRATREDAELAEALLEVARQQAAQEHVGITSQEFDELGDSDPFEQTTPGNTLSPFAGHPDPFKTVNEGELSPVKPISS
ncbi:MAG TPA: hypothetical protein DCE42_20925, partial [Myxococcales bacterium]|nr:hypothetical protein [Myxococcales bacterium]